MSRVVAARMQGDDYQARFFWCQACRLFYPNSKVLKVGYEVDNPRSLDDVAVFYRQGFLDTADGEEVAADYFQVKFHVTYDGRFTFSGLMDPRFINAKSTSILQRLHNARQLLKPTKGKVRFILKAPWAVDPNDLLAEIWSQEDGSIRLDKLFDGTTDRSRMGKLRKSLRDHLGVSDEELRLTLQPLRIHADAPSLAALQDCLDFKLWRAGLQPVGEGSLVSPYDDLVRKLVSAGRTEFTKEDIEHYCRVHGLIRPPDRESVPVVRVGIRSFTLWTEDLLEHSDELVDLTGSFAGRSLREGLTWQHVYAELRERIRGLRAGPCYHAELCVHTTLAYAVGYLLPAKSGLDVVPVQRFDGSSPWSPATAEGTEDWPGLRWSDNTLDPNASDTVVAVSICHNTIDDVMEHIRKSALPVNRVVHGAMVPAPSMRSVRSGSHAWQLAADISRQLEQRSAREREGVVHLFLSVPVSLAFFLGQSSRSFGLCALYEYNLGTGLLGDYHRSLVFPASESQ